MQEEVARLREENAKLVAKMREILVRYKAMQEQLSSGDGAAAGGATAGAGGGGGGGEGPSENEQKLVGKLKGIVGKYKELQTLSKVGRGFVYKVCVCVCVCV